MAGPGPGTDLVEVDEAGARQVSGHEAGAVGATAERPAHVDRQGWTTGYEGSDFGIYAALFAVAILVFELLPVLWPRLSMRGWPTAVITAILGVGLALCTLVKLIEDNEFQTRWAWVGFAIALFVMLVALLRVRHRWGIRGRDAEPPPAGLPSSPDPPAA